MLATEVLCSSSSSSALWLGVLKNGISMGQISALPATNTTDIHSAITNGGRCAQEECCQYKHNVKVQTCTSVNPSPYGQEAEL